MPFPAWTEAGDGQFAALDSLAKLKREGFDDDAASDEDWISKGLAIGARISRNRAETWDH